MEICDLRVIRQNRTVQMENYGYIVCFRLSSAGHIRKENTSEGLEENTPLKRC